MHVCVHGEDCWYGTGAEGGDKHPCSKQNQQWWAIEEGGWHNNVVVVLLYVLCTAMWRVAQRRDKARKTAFRITMSDLGAKLLRPLVVFGLCSMGWVGLGLRVP